MAPWTWLNHFFKKLAVETYSDVPGSLVRLHYLGRRDQTRIRLPELDHPFIPQVFLYEVPLPIVNISVGGVCLKDTQNLFSQEIGHEVIIHLKWKGEKIPVRSRVVAVSRHFHRHLCFLDLSSSHRAHLGWMVQMGFMGQRLKPTPIISSSPAKLEAVELWTGVTGDSLAFLNKDDLLAELFILDRCYKFFSLHLPRIQLSEMPSRSRPARKNEILDTLFYLENVDRPTPRVLSLIAHLITRSQSWSMTGRDP